MEALYTVACSTKSDHVGAAKGKNSEQRLRLHQDPDHGKGSQLQLCSWACRLCSQPQPEFMQAHRCMSFQPGGL